MEDDIYIAEMIVRPIVNFRSKADLLKKGGEGGH